MTNLQEVYLEQGKSIESIAAYVQQYINDNYQDVLERMRPTLEEIRAKAGDFAYARYSNELFKPILDELKQLNITCDPALPGTFPLSREQWGAEDERERRFWCVVSDGEKTLGSLIFRFFHDHTTLRLPHSPIIVSKNETNHTIIAQLVERSEIPGL